MRILLLTAYFPPDTGSAAHLFYDLGMALSVRGHGVTVITGMPAYHPVGSLDRYQGRRWIREVVNGMHVVRVATPRLPRRWMVARAVWQFSGAILFYAAGLLLSRHDVTMVYSPPLPLGLAAWSLRVFKATPFILNVQDLFPQSIIDLGLLKNRWIIRAFESMERFLYREADAITVHSEGNREYVVAKGALQEKVQVVPNWVDTVQIQPSDRNNGFRRRHGLNDAFVVSFAGVLGYSQDLDIVLEAAAILRDYRDIVWLIVGDGVEKVRLEAKAREMSLSNVRFLPMQARDEYPAILHASDICLTTLHAAVRTPVVPSKIVSAMAAGRPVIAALNLDGDAPRLIAEAKCGICVPPEDARALAASVLRLYQDPDLRQTMGRNGRIYAERYLSTNVCVDAYEALLQRVARESTRR